MSALVTCPSCGALAERARWDLPTERQPEDVRGDDVAERWVDAPIGPTTTTIEPCGCTWHGRFGWDRGQLTKILAEP